MKTIENYKRYLNRFFDFAKVKSLGQVTEQMVRNAPTKLMKNLKYGKGYEMYDKESYLPEKISKKKYLKDEK